MRHLLVLFGVVCVSLSAFAQATIPGTFSRQTSSNTIAVGGYVVAPPSIALGNGLSPAVVTNVPTVEVTSPQNVSAPAAPANLTTNPDRSNINGLAASPSKHFDYVVAGNETTYTASAEDGHSLAEVATNLRRNRVQASKVFTNEDIKAMNERNGTPRSELQNPPDSPPQFLSSDK